MSGPFPQLPVKRVATVTLGKMLQPSASSFDDVLMPYLRAAHIQPGGRILELEEQPMWFSRSERRSLQLSSEDVVVVEGGAGYGRSARILQDRPGWGFQNSILRVRRIPELSIGAFIYYAFQAALDSGQIAVVCNTATFAHFTAEKVAALEIPAPSLARQRAVVSFLDRETAEIDAFIADQEELIGLLAERRAATISHAVTKGLDPTVPMKDSGVEWLGEVNADWSITRLKNIAEILPGFAFSSDSFSETSDAIPLLRGINVGVGKIDWKETVSWDRAVDAGLETYLLREGDIVVGLDRPIISGGVRVARVGKADAPSLLVQRVARIRAIGANSASFIEYLMGAQAFADYLSPLFTGVSVPHISPSQVGDFGIAVPLPEVQARVVRQLDFEVSEIDEAISDAKEAIVLSRERRAALISAAVTGKIDVREHEAVA